ncbi:membrane protein insertion efficiency factor YidD [Clostridium sediminicola]
MLKKIIIYFIKIYRKYISPLKAPSCRFYPTCSQYAIQAIEKYGLLRGGFMSIKRIARCNPYSRGGYDPVK